MNGLRTRSLSDSRPNTTRLIALNAQYQLASALARWSLYPNVVAKQTTAKPTSA